MVISGAGSFGFRCWAGWSSSPRHAEYKFASAVFVMLGALKCLAIVFSWIASILVAVDVRLTQRVFTEAGACALFRRRATDRLQGSPHRASL